MTSPSIVLLRTQSDERLVVLARGGHERAFEAIVERYRRPLLRTCRRILSESRAEDALQQALVAAWRGLRRGDQVRDLRPWLYRIAHNTALNHLRMAGYDFDELKESLRVADATDDELERRAIVRQTLTGLAALPERQRDALLAIAVEGRSQDQVAEELGLSQGAVRQLVHRARTTLRAGATAVTPLPLVSWVAAAGTRTEPLAQRLAELSAGAGGASAATALAKAGAVVVLAGGAVGGPALVEKERSDAAHRAAQRAAVRSPDRAQAPPALPADDGAGAQLVPATDGGDRHPSGGSEPGEDGGTPHRRGPATQRGEAHRGPGSSRAPGRSRDGRSREDRSGGGADDRSGSSGSSGGGSGSSGGTRGSSSGESRDGGSSGSSDSGSSGSGSSGSGSSGPATTDGASSGSGSSGSGSSGSSDSGSSGSGSSGSSGSGSGATAQPVADDGSSGDSSSSGGGSSGSGSSGSTESRSGTD